jgi:hypothetical protein
MTQTHAAISAPQFLYNAVVHLFDSRFTRSMENAPQSLSEQAEIERL